MPDPSDDRAFDPTEEFIGPGGRRMSRRRFLASGGALAGAAAAGPLLISRVDAGELGRALGRTNLPYNAHTGVKGHVSFWHHYGSPLRHGAIREAITLFNRIYKNVHVNDVGFAFGASWDKMKADIAAGGAGAPELIVSDRPKLYYDGGRHGYYQSVSDLVKRDRFSMNAYWKFIQNDSIYKGKVYGLGWETDCRVLFHLRATFIDAGLKPDVSPASWSDVTSYAGKLDQKGGAINGWNLLTFDPLENYNLPSWVWTDNGDFVTRKGQPTVNSPAMVRTASWIKQWLDRYGGFDTHQALLSLSQGGQADNPMTKKNAVFHVDTPTNQAVWEFYDLRFYTKDGTRIYPYYGAGLLPYGPGGKPINVTGGFDLSMPRKHMSSAQRDATWEFMKYMSLVGQRYFAQKVTALPSVIALSKDAILQATPNWKTFIKGLAYGHLNVAVADPAFPADVLGDAVVNPMWQGTRSVTDTLNAAQAQAVANMGRPGQ